MYKRSLGLLTSVMVLSGVMGCSPWRYEDDDGSCSTAKPLPPSVVVKDDLNRKMGDVTDCKAFTYFKDAKAKIEYSIGTPFDKHNMKGSLRLYDSDGRILDEKGVDPTIHRYNFEVDVKARKKYFVELKITEGAYGYSAQVQYEVDPCSRCTADERCEDKKCVPKVKVCSPSCDAEAGMLCQDGECVYQCSKSCQRKNPRKWSCDVETGECERVLKRCSPRCRRGMRCNRRTGQCYTPAPKTCRPACAPGTVCRKGACITLGGPAKCPPGCTGQCGPATNYKCVTGGTATDSPIVGSLTSTVRAGTSTVIYINRGKRHGVKRGASGKLCGKHRFTITNVYATRSKGRTSASIEELGECKRVVVPR